MFLKEIEQSALIGLGHKTWGHEMSLDGADPELYGQVQFPSSIVEGLGFLCAYHGIFLGVDDENRGLQFRKDLDGCYIVHAETR